MPTATRSSPSCPDRAALDCALRYRPLYDKRPAGGVARKAGRFVFDIWGGHYGEDAAKLRRMFDYGLTDALFLKHVWQRLGLRLPAARHLAPRPQAGHARRARAIGQLCGRYDVPWGLHDNYVDFYPDAAGYSYKHISFDADGQPRKAWINTGSRRPELLLAARPFPAVPGPQPGAAEGESAPHGLVRRRVHFVQRLRLTTIGRGISIPSWKPAAAGARPSTPSAIRSAATPPPRRRPAAIT